MSREPIPTHDKGNQRVQQWQTRQEGIGSLYRTSTPIPSPRQDEVLVKIKAVSLNYRDCEVISGIYNHHKTIDSRPGPLVPCSDMCGIVTAVGDGPAAVEWNVGDRVMAISMQTYVTGQIKAHHLAHGLGLPLNGVLQTHRVFESAGLVRVPEYLTDEEASCMPVAGITAWMSINGMRPFGHPGGQGESVLLLGTGGVSVCGLQIARASGATTIITSSSDMKLEKAKALGADYVINYRTTPEWQEEVLSVTNGEGADIIFECGGAKTWRKSFEAVAFGGLINSIGGLTGVQNDPEDRMNVNVLAATRNVTLKGILNGPKDQYEEMCKFYTKYNIRPPVCRVFKFEESREALVYLYSGAHFGKVVIKVEE
ncbi:alcohol dehydrogenase [Xylariales sp. PMI_506]|nr:alcohol dehydrogenase [Xylariales sp. PMI_506]